MGYVVAVLALINLLAFLAMGRDKEKSRDPQARRMPEGEIFFWAAAFGSLGVYLGMLFFRHKTRKWYFALGIPLLILENIACIYLLYLLFSVF